MEHLPLWFLIVALFLPRVSLVIAYLADDLVWYGLHGWIPPTLAVVVPRVLVIILIFQDRGFSGWLLVHGIALACVYGGAGATQRD